MLKIAVEKELVDRINKRHYTAASEKPSVISALTAIRNDDNSMRIIHDGSRPVGQAMNHCFIPDSVKFQALADACKLAKPGYWCAKVDLRSAYGSVCIHPDKYSVTGLKWTFHNEKEPMYLFDSRLPFGRNVGPSHFHRLSQAIRRYMERRGMTGVMAYIDDFLLTASSKDECNKMLLSLIRLLRELGFNTSWKKVVGPTQRIRFLGVDIGTRTSTLSLGEDKLQQLRQRLLQFKSKRRASKQQLESLAGSLNWACQTVSGLAGSLNWACQTVSGLAGSLNWACQTVSGLAGSLKWACQTVSGLAGSLKWACQTVSGLAGSLNWACQTVSGPSGSLNWACQAVSGPSGFLNWACQA